MREQGDGGGAANGATQRVRAPNPRPRLDRRRTLVVDVEPCKPCAAARTRVVERRAAVKGVGDVGIHVATDPAVAGGDPGVLRLDEQLQKQKLE